MADFARALRDAQALISEQAAAHFAGQSGDLADAMHYALDGGKALRAFLALESGRLHGVNARAAAFAIECIHAYSLIHDDLPCMDDDDLRRGKPTVHRKWTEAVAVLAGDGLQTLGFEFLTGADCPDGAKLVLLRTLAQAAGAQGMIGGQMLDIAAETAPEKLTLEQITTLQDGKTGALITWSCLVGPRMAAQDEAPLQTYGDALGLAFQITDDILDVTGDVTAVGKALGKDAGAGKATFVSLLGLDGARARAAELVDAACAALDGYGSDAETLKQAAQFVVARDR